MNSNFKQMTEWFNDFLIALEQTANRWSSGIFVLIKTISALFGLVAVMSVIIVSTQWYIITYGGGIFVLTLILSSFALSALTTITVNKKK